MPNPSSQALEALRKLAVCFTRLAERNLDRIPEERFICFKREELEMACLIDQCFEAGKANEESLVNLSAPAVHQPVAPPPAPSPSKVAPSAAIPSPDKIRLVTGPGNEGLAARIKAELATGKKYRVKNLADALGVPETDVALAINQRDSGLICGAGGWVRLAEENEK
jgi:hypothetical protein